MEALDGLARVTDETVAETPGVFASFFGPDPLNLVFVVLLTSLGTWGLPQMVQKFYAIKDEESIKKGTIISTVFALVVAGGCYFLGGFGRRSDRRGGKRVRFHYSDDAFRAFADADRTGRDPRAFGVHVHAFVPCHGIKLHAYD